MVEAIPESSRSSRCLQASASLASDHFGLWLGPEFHADVEFWPLTVAWGMWSSVGTLEAPLYSLYPQRPSYTLWSDASGDALRGYCLESGLWWRLDLDANVRARLRSCNKHRNDLSIKLLAMVITAWVFVVQAGSRPTYARESIPMRGDNQTATKCKRDNEPRSGACLLYTSPSPRD